MKYKIGDRVKTSMTDEEGVIIATDDRFDLYSKVKIKYDGIFGSTRWWNESMVDKVITQIL